MYPDLANDHTVLPFRLSHWPTVRAGEGFCLIQQGCKITSNRFVALELQSYLFVQYD